MWLVPGVVWGAAVMAADLGSTKIFPEQTGITSDAETLENIGRQQLLSKSNNMVKEANALMLEGKYRDAIKKYRENINMLRNHRAGDKFRARIEFCEKRIADCYYKMAERAMKKADDYADSYNFEDAVKICQEAVEFCPERKEELQERIKHYQTRRNAAVARESLDINKLDPGFNSQEYEMQLLIEQGIVLMRRSEYMLARRKFEQVLLIDPYNEVALQNLLGINTKIRDAATNRSNATSRHNIGAVEWAAAIPIVADSSAGVGENQLEAPAEKVDEKSELEQELHNLIIPNYVIYADLMGFREAMDELQTQIKKVKPSGINFVIRDAKYNSPDEMPKLRGFSPEKMSVYQILTELKKRGDLTFKIEDNVVVIAAKGQVLEKMTVRSYSFSLADVTKDSLMANLKSAGVTFDKGASIHLMPARNEVVSRNTPTNQKLIEQWLAENSEKGTPMVQIMFKFLEVAQNDLDELGFNWEYSRFNSNVNFEAGGNSLLRHYANDDANDRFGGTGVTSSKDKNGVDPDATYNVTWRDSKNALSFGVYALDWADSSDVLYSPRVTTKHNTTAVVNMGEKHHYPGDYEDVDSESSDNVRVFVTSPQPALDDERTLGITFSIHPVVTDNLVRAKVNFNILTFDSWLVVDSRNPNNDDDDGEYQKKAVLNTRSINTDVTLKDGETVLIGSISQDLTNVMHDKIPILGDIPFVGRFFQSKYTVSKKNNLLIFMTCKLVGPDGSAWNKDPETGKAQNVGGERGFPVFPRNL